MALKFTIYGEPPLKLRHRFSRKSGIAYTPSKTKKAEENFLAQAISFKPPKPIESNLRASIHAYYTTPLSFSKKKRRMALSGEIRPAKKPDIDNLAKAVLDSLNTVFYQDDKQIVELIVRKFYSDTPRTEVVLEETE